MTALGVFEALLASRLSGLGKVWPPPGERFAISFHGATRALGRAPLALTPSQAAPLLAWGVERPALAWAIDEAARVMLLLEASESLRVVQMVGLAEELYGQGDSREQAAILRALPFLPQPEAFLPLALEASRSSVQPVFEALACENPFPAAQLPELDFNQLVLKALVLELRLPRILGWKRRLNRELARLAEAWGDERRAAGRSVPPELAHLIPAQAEAR